MPAPFLEMQDISKTYGRVRALNGVSFSARPGEVVGVIGANGAGKSTLTRVISGITRHDDGLMKLDGQEVRFHHPRDALASGIALVPQELSLVEDQSVAENLFLGRMPAVSGLVRYGEMRARAREALDRVGLDDVDPLTPAGALTPVEQRLVTIAEAISKSPRLLILDEPSAALPSETAARLGPIIRSIAEQGTTVMYVSHRLNEILALSDRVFAMRDGSHSGDLARDEITIARMVEMVGGKALDEEPEPATRQRLDAPVLVSASGLCGVAVQDVDLTVHAGEIVGVGGLQGSGRSELLRLIAGVQPKTAGELDVLGAGAPHNPAEAVRTGIGYVPEGRKAMVFPDMSVAANSTIAIVSDIAKVRTFLNVKRERELARKISERLRLKGDIDAPISALSGGNQQKSCMARWLLKDVKLLVLDEPTVGIDVHARAEIHTLLREIAAEGTAVVVACSEPEELVLLCHRVVVMVEGRLRRELHAPFEADKVVAASYAEEPALSPQGT